MLVSRFCWLNKTDRLLMDWMYVGRGTCVCVSSGLVG